MQNGVFLKGDLHVHVPVKGQEIPKPDVRIPKKDGGHFPAVIYPYCRHENRPLKRQTHRASESISYTIKQPRVGNIFFKTYTARITILLHS